MCVDVNELIHTGMDIPCPILTSQFKTNVRLWTRITILSRLRFAIEEELRIFPNKNPEISHEEHVKNMFL